MTFMTLEADEKGRIGSGFAEVKEDAPLASYLLDRAFFAGGNDMTLSSPSAEAAAFESLPAAAFSADMNLTIISWNQRMAKLSSWDALDVIGKNLAEVLTPLVIGGESIITDLMARIAPQPPLSNFRENADDACMEITLRALPEKNFSLLHHRIRNIEGKDEGFGFVLVPRSVVLPSPTEGFHRRLLNLSPGMAYQLLNDGQWSIRYVSEGCRDLTGYEPEYFINHPGSTLHSLIHPDDVSRIQEAFHSSIINKQRYEQEYRLLDANGNEKWVQEHGSGVYSSKEEFLAFEGFITDITLSKHKEQALLGERHLLQTALRDRHGFGEIVGQSPAMQKVFEMIIKAAISSDNVFIFGETGTGKELVAHAIHNNSTRKDQPFIAVNCGAIPEGLVESAFFGHKKGAFTNATQNQKGYLEAANGGTLFLDEIGEISLSMQVKLLRALEKGGFSPVGGQEVIHPNLRIIAASNKDLNEMVHDGQIRRDFFYRIYIIPIHLPPLREREGDIELLARTFFDMFGDPVTSPPLTKHEIAQLKSYPWPGNVRELQNVIRRYITIGNLNFLQDMANKELAEAQDGALTAEEEGSFNLEKAVESFEKHLLVRALEQTKWHKMNAAQLLGISRRTLFRKLKLHGLD